MKFTYKSYCWSIGTTSFRVTHLNYKLEKQLKMLKVLFNNNPGSPWINLQEDYYNLMQSEEFITGAAPRKGKDARQKTSGLVDLGLVTSQRKITQIGEEILTISLSNDYTCNNDFGIAADSYVYLKQLLKMEINNSDLKVKPFIFLIYMLIKLEYLTLDEFTYLLPICKNKDDLIKMITNIKSIRACKANSDVILTETMWQTGNYKNAFDYLLKEPIISEETFEIVGMNRKSATYDRAYFKIYDLLHCLCFEKGTLKSGEKVSLFIKLYNAIDELSSNLNSIWKKHIFQGLAKKKLTIDFEEKLYSLSIFSHLDELSFRKNFYELMQLIKWKATLEDYQDLNRRYFTLADILIFEKDRISMDLLPKYYFGQIIDSMIESGNILSERDYIIRFHSSLELAAIVPLSVQVIDEAIDTVNKELGTDLTKTTILTYLESERDKKINKLIDERYTADKLLRLLEYVETRKDSQLNDYVTDNADIPTIFEYIVGISWYLISERRGRILDYLNLSLDANLLPRTHAGGGQSDIVYKYPDHDLLLEVTLSEASNQRRMEMEPVSRHLGQNIATTNNLNNYCVFVAPYLAETVILDFRGRRYMSYPKGKGEYIRGMKIIPLDTRLLKVILQKNITYTTLNKLFQDAYVSSIDDTEWFESTIVKKII